MVTLFNPLAAQKAPGEITKNEDGKYILTEKGAVEPLKPIWLNKDFEDKSLTAHHKYLPIGSKIQVVNTETKRAIAVTIRGRMEPGEEAILQLNNYIFFKLIEDKGYITFDFPGQVVYVTPIDSLLNILPEQKDEEKTHTYLQLANIYRHYEPETALTYAHKTVSLAKKTGNLDKEAEAWLLIGDVQLDMVEKEVIEYSWKLHYPRDPDKVIKKIATDSNYPEEDVIRWNRLGGDFFYFQSYFSFHDDVVLYPEPEKISDDAYQHYLSIREQQQDNEKVIWGLKCLGDLHRIKTSYAAAEPYYLKILKLREEGNALDKKAWIWGYLAEFYWEQKKYAEAEKYFQKLYALRENKQAIDPLRLIWVMGGLRNLRYTEGKIAEAIEMQSKMFPLYKEVGRDNRESTLEYIIRDYLRVFKDEKEEVKTSLEKWYRQEVDEPKEKIVLAETLAKLYAENEQYDKAAEFAKDIVSLVVNDMEKIARLNDAAFYYQLNESWDKSLAYYNQAYDLCVKNENKTLEAIQLYKIGYFYSEAETSGNATKYYKKSLKTIKKVPSNSMDDFWTKLLLRDIIKSTAAPQSWRVSFAKECHRIAADDYDKTMFKRLIKKIE